MHIHWIERTGQDIRWKVGWRWHREEDERKRASEVMLSLATR